MIVFDDDHAGNKIRPHELYNVHLYEKLAQRIYKEQEVGIVAG